MLRHLRNGLLFCTQRFSRRKNCRIDRLIFDDQYTRNLTSNNLLHRIQQNEMLHLFKHLFLEKNILLLDKSANHVIYCVASQIWQLLQRGMGLQARPMEGQKFILSFSEEAAKMLCIVLQCIFRHDLQQSRVSKLSQYQYVLLLCQHEGFHICKI